MLEKKTKAELIELVKKLEEKVNQLENDVEYWQEENTELEDKIEDLDTQLADMEIADGIKDKNIFIDRLKLENLYSRELEEFIENYLKFYND